MRRSPLRFRWLGAALLATPGVAQAGDGLYVGDLGQAIAAVLTFGLLVVVLGRFAWKPIIRQLRQRELHVASTLKRAGRAEADAEDMRRHYESRMARADQEAERVVAKARNEAADAGEDLLQTARAQAQETTEAAHRQIDQARTEAMGELQETTVALATDLAGKIVGKELDAPDAQDELFTQAMDDIAGQVRRSS